MQEAATHPQTHVYPDLTSSHTSGTERKEHIHGYAAQGADKRDTDQAQSCGASDTTAPAAVPLCPLIFDPTQKI